MPMIDWVKARLPCYHAEPINGGRIMRVNPDGSIEWQTETRLAVRGSFDAALHVKTHAVAPDGSGVILEIDGNPVKWLQGHNLWGTDDLIGLVCETMERLVPLLGLEPSDSDRKAWESGVFELQRVDVTDSYELRNRADCLAWIRSAEHSAHMRHRGKGQITKGNTLYFGKHSRRWSLKVYSKGQEIVAPGHELPEGIATPAVLAWADNKLRFEAVLRKMWLTDRGLDVAANWGDNTPAELLTELLQGLHMSDTHTLPADVLEGLPPRLVAAYHLWREGHDLRAMFPHRTFYRYRSQLLPHGVDIAIKQPREKSNVVPLVRVLEAKPATIPDWARGTPLYFEPRRRFG
jgi:II/X family phage/plasmid replication protein